MFTMVSKTTEEKRKTAIKLHKQFAHPRSDRLIKLTKNGGTEDRDLFSMIQEVEATCEICIKYKKPHSRPVVGFSLGKEFNHTVSMDLKTFKGVQFLHLIDNATRFSAAAIITSKHKEVIIDLIFKHRIALFGAPNRSLSDNGGEFNNELYKEMAELLNIEVLSTASESPWSNGIAERHNAIIGNMLERILEENKYSMEVALAWAVSAKNSLQNVYGYSPNQLVIGKNPSFPTVLNNDPPALESSTASEVVAEHLNALHAARKAYIAGESCEKLRRAMKHGVRPATSLVYQTGDVVFYKRNESSKWKGPDIVIGRDNHQVFVKHGGPSTDTGLERSDEESQMINYKQQSNSDLITVNYELKDG